jgi:hypothetical protein
MKLCPFGERFGRVCCGICHWGCSCTRLVHASIVIIVLGVEELEHVPHDIRLTIIEVDLVCMCILPTLAKIPKDGILRYSTPYLEVSIGCRSENLGLETDDRSVDFETPSLAFDGKVRVFSRSVQAGEV